MSNIKAMTETEGNEAIPVSDLKAKSKVPKGFKHEGHVWVRILGYPMYEVCRDGYVRKANNKGDGGFILLKPNNFRKDWVITPKTRYTLVNESGDVKSVALAKILYTAFHGKYDESQFIPVISERNINEIKLERRRNAIPYSVNSKKRTRKKDIANTRPVIFGGYGGYSRPHVYTLIRSVDASVYDLSRVTGDSYSSIYAVIRGEAGFNNIYVKPGFFTDHTIMYVDIKGKERELARIPSWKELTSPLDITIIGENPLSVIEHKLKHLIYDTLKKAEVLAKKM